MKSKLTLRLEKEIIERAKEYSAERGESVSNLVEKFFKLLSEKGRSEGITPTVKKLKGLLKDSKVSESDYKKYLEEKYL
jgi:predicted HicB family RNase H-like nuclease